MPTFNEVLQHPDFWGADTTDDDRKWALSQASQEFKALPAGAQDTTLQRLASYRQQRAADSEKEAKQWAAREEQRRASEQQRLAKHDAEVASQTPPPSVSPINPVNLATSAHQGLGDLLKWGYKKAGELDTNPNVPTIPLIGQRKTPEQAAARAEMYGNVTRDVAETAALPWTKVSPLGRVLMSGTTAASQRALEPGATVGEVLKSGLAGAAGAGVVEGGIKAVGPIRRNLPGSAKRIGDEIAGEIAPTVTSAVATATPKSKTSAGALAEILRPGHKGEDALGLRLAAIEKHGDPDYYNYVAKAYELFKDTVGASLTSSGKNTVLNVPKLQEEFTKRAAELKDVLPKDSYNALVKAIYRGGNVTEKDVVGNLSAWTAKYLGPILAGVGLGTTVPGGNVIPELIGGYLGQNVGTKLAGSAVRTKYAGKKPLELAAETADKAIRRATPVATAVAKNTPTPKPADLVPFLTELIQRGKDKVTGSE